MILGIESTAHTFGIGVVDNGRVLCNVKDSYTTEKGGIIPVESAKHHKECAERVFEEAINKAGIKRENISSIAISQAPGLAPCLLEGMRFAKKTALELNVPIIPVNHCVAHLEIGKITGAKDPVLLYASGANTQIIAYAAGKYRVFGETLDIGIGNFIDTFARHCGLGFPGGPKIMKLAETGKYIEVPYTVKGMDVAFSGLLTNLKQKYDRGEKIENLSYSLQENAFAMLIEASERALAHTGKKELLLGGGVACNARLQEMCRVMCGERGCKFFVPENSLLVDNGAMIAFLGEIIYNSINKTKNNKKETKLIYFPRDFDKLDINPRERTDDVVVTWR